MIWSVIFGLTVAGIIFWALNGQSTAIRLAATSFSGIVMLVTLFKWRFSANSKSAQNNRIFIFFVSKILAPQAGLLPRRSRGHAQGIF